MSSYLNSMILWQINFLNENDIFFMVVCLNIQNFIEKFLWKLLFLNKLTLLSMLFCDKALQVKYIFQLRIESFI
jgi:hypothetical protein